MDPALLRLCVALSVALFFGAPGASAEVFFVPKKSSLRSYVDQAHVLISGEITASDVAELRRTLTERRQALGKTPLVLLDSPGGSVLAALEMGRIIRRTPAETVINDGASCSSSCIFLQSAGVKRNVFGDGRLGLHRPRFDYEDFASLSKEDARIEYTKLVAVCEQYMREMGISDDVFSDMLRVPSQEVRFVGRDYAEQHDLVGRDPAWEEWTRANEVKQKGEEKVLAEDRFEACINEKYQAGLDWDDCSSQYQKNLNALERAEKK